MMKKLSLMLILTAGIAHAAADGQIVPHEGEICILPKPAAVINHMIRTGVQSVAASEDKYSLISSVGKIYVTIDKDPEGVKSLEKDSAVTAQTRVYQHEILGNTYLQELAAMIKTLREEQKPEFERIMALAAYGGAFSLLQKQLTEQDIPGLNLRATVKGTIEKNPLHLSKPQKITFKAAQLSMTLNLQQQYEMDPVTFDRMFPTPETATASSRCLLL